jgi:hypothetical protein
MPRQSSKPQDSQSEVSLINKDSELPPHPVSEDIVVCEVKSRAKPEPAPAPVVTTDKDGTITIK